MAVGTWAVLTNQPPTPVQVMLLLTDGTVMAHDSGNGIRSSSWYRLTPDSKGKYATGTWSALPPMHDSRRFFSSDILTDGRVMVAGGEYGTGRATAEVYDPVKELWSYTQPAGQDFSDSVSELLPDGKVLVGPLGTLRRAIRKSTHNTAIYDPLADTWTNGPSPFGSQNEASWVKLPDGSILTVDKGSTASERYIPALDEWIVDGTVPVALYDVNNELGPAFLLPNGKAFFLGASGQTALYTPSGTTNAGTWTAGPMIPNGRVSSDASAAMMVNGKILCNVGPVAGGTSRFEEYDSVGNSFTAAPFPGATPDPDDTDFIVMLDVPDGTVLVAHFQEGDVDTNIYAYQPDGTPLASGKPTITNVAANTDGSYLLTGTLLNGISEGAAFGDDIQMATNFPIVQLTDASSNVYYARTYNWSNTGVMTGAAAVTTDFSLPPGLPAGDYSVAVSANGNLSDSVPFLAAPAAPPLARDDQAALSGKAPITIPVLANDDVAVGLLTITSVTPPSLGDVVIINSGTALSYTPGLNFLKYSGSDSFTYTVTVGNGQTSTAAVRVFNPFYQHEGKYFGIVSETGPNLFGDGFINITVASDGAFTGRITVNLENNAETGFMPETFKLKGTFPPSGSVITNVTSTTGFSATLFLQANFFSTVETAPYGKIIGSIASSAFSAYHTLVKSPDNPGTAPAPEAGKYTILFPSVSVADGTIPNGTGYARLKVSASGAVTIVGALADGTAISGGVNLTAGNTSLDPNLASFYIPLRYKSPGFLAGALAFADLPAVSDCGGAFTWNKPAQSVTGLYQSGFRVKPAAIGSHYTRPPAGTRVSILPPAPVTRPSCLASKTSPP